MDQKKLIDAAIKARENSYSPYSHFKVGAAILLTNGKIISGTNIENSSYGLSMCAERNTIFQTYCLGYKKEDIVALAVVADTEGPCSPCGACRQVIDELLPDGAPIVLANLKGDVVEIKKEDLLPYSFKPEDLE